MANLWIMKKGDTFACTIHLYIVRRAEHFGWKIWAIIAPYTHGKNKLISDDILSFRVDNHDSPPFTEEPELIRRGKNRTKEVLSE